jgi:hypothetical protein
MKRGVRAWSEEGVLINAERSIIKKIIALTILWGRKQNEAETDRFEK